ncbi:VanZ family protein [Salimicrobium flavidum]|uniref:VanZ like family protein n=1 Tax=Salimicrobium flavidum TaxID=570947 RepID=A0A1N7J015_9BACI|nr:VanZ family protein [Salimicrobium flavidum]SIS42561.1 hypothetical protein SAMN05421687_10365 [Salimicrobium flavidum]
MKKLILLGWLLLIFVGTCTENLDAFLFEGEVRFDFTSVPDWTDIGMLGPESHIRVRDVVGHYFMFSILTLLIYFVRRSLGSTLFIVSGFAVLTEIAQRFFARGTELYDLIANFIGISVTLLTIWVIVLRLRRPSE